MIVRKHICHSIAAAGLLVGGCRGPVDRQKAKAGDSADDGGATEDSGAIGLNQVAVGAHLPEEGLIHFSVGYGMSGPEGWDDRLTFVGEDFFAFGRPEGFGVLDWSGQDFCLAVDTGFPPMTVDLGPQFDFSVGERAFDARRVAWQEGEVEYYWSRDAHRRYRVGEGLAAMGFSGPTVPDPVALVSRWDWEAKRQELVRDRRLRLDWTSSDDPDSYIYLTIVYSTGDSTDPEDVAYHHIGCSFADDGMAEVIQIPGIDSTYQFVDMVDIGRARVNDVDHPDLGIVRFKTSTTMWLTNDNGTPIGVGPSQPSVRPPGAGATRTPSFE